MKSKFAPDHQDTSNGWFNPGWDDPNFLNGLPSASDNGVSRAPPADPIPPTPALSNEAIQAESAQTGSTSTVVVTSGGITFDLIFDAAATAAPASFQAGIEQAASILAATIANKITVNIDIDYSGTGGGAAAGPDNGQYVSYSTVKTDLISNAAPGDTTFNSLPAGSTIQGQSQVAVWNAQLKLFGLLPANSTTTDDGSATFATDINPSLLVGVALHELTHALGRIPYGPEPDIFDFDRFTGAGTRLFTENIPATAAYFSLDGGVTKLADYGQNSDPSDFLNPPGSNLTSNDAFNEFYNNNTLQQLTAVDLKQLDALGFYIGTPVNHPPVVTIPSANVSATAGQVIAASSLFSATDADGDTLSYYVYDNNAGPNGGHFVVNGTVVPSQVVYPVSAAQLAQTTFVAGAAGMSDELRVIAYDGQTYSNNSVFNYLDVNVTGVNHAPVVTIPSANVSASPGQVIAASSLFTATDADGNTLNYYIYDDNPAANSGHFVVNGTVVPAQDAYLITAAQLAQTSFVAGAAGTSDELRVIAYDGQTYSNNSVFNYLDVNVAGDHAPVITVPSANVSATAGQVIAASNLFTATDADGDTLSYYLYDNNSAANSGHFVVNGTVVPSQVVYPVSAAQLAQTTFVAGASGTSDELRVIAYDGQTYSNNGVFNFFNVDVAGVNSNHAPVVTIPSANVSASPGQVIAASSLFTATDADGDTLSYYLYDNNSAANSGHFVVNGTVVPSQVVYPVSAAQLSQTSFVAGAAGTSDELRVIAFDGQAYSNNSVFTYLNVNVVLPTGPASPTISAIAGDNFVFARGLGQNVSSELFQSVSAPLADHLSQIFGAGGAAPIDGNGTFGSHVDAAVDPLALFGLHAAPHIADHFGV